MSIAAEVAVVLMSRGVFSWVPEDVPNATIVCYWTIMRLGKATSCLFGGSMLYRGPRPDMAKDA